MKRKTINAVLNKKFNLWLKSIDDESVHDLVKNNTIITGGCIASMLLGEDINDFDIYFRNKETTKAVAEYYVKKFNEKYDTDRATVIDCDQYDCEFKNMFDVGRIKVFIRSEGVAEAPEEIEQNEELKIQARAGFSSVKEAGESDLKRNGKFAPVFLSPNAITLSDQIQLVIRFYGEPEEIHKNYDFVHVTNYWTSWDRKVFLNQEALESLLTKVLVYKGSKYPVCSVIRTRKFIQRGWRITAGEFLKMLFQVSQLDLTDVDVLEEQLVGVDSAYFNIFIEKLKSFADGDPSFSIDNTYVCEIVNKVFG